MANDGPRNKHSSNDLKQTLTSTQTCQIHFPFALAPPLRLMATLFNIFISPWNAWRIDLIHEIEGADTKPLLRASDNPHNKKKKSTGGTDVFSVDGILWAGQFKPDGIYNDVVNVTVSY